MELISRLQSNQNKTTINFMHHLVGYPYPGVLFSHLFLHYHRYIKKKTKQSILLLLVLGTIKKYLIKFLNQYYNHLVHNHAHLTVNLTHVVSHTTNTICKKQLLGIVSDALKYVNFQSKMTCAVNFNALESLYFLSFWSTNFACLKSCDSS